MKRELPTFKSTGSIVLLLLLLACATMVSGQQTHSSIVSPQTLRTPQIAQLIGNGPKQNIPRPSNRGERAPSVVCDTDLFMDYSSYSEVEAERQHLNYNGSWEDTTNHLGLYLQAMTNYITIASGDSGYISYAGLVFDSLLFANPIDTQSTYIPLATSTVYFDSLGVFEALNGDTTHMANDSLIFLVYSLTNGTFSTNPVKSLVYKGWPTLRQFYAPTGYVNYVQVPIHYQLTQGQGFAVIMEYHNHRVTNRMNLAYSYPDSCGTVVYGGHTYPSPAYPPVLAGNDFYGSISFDTAGVVDYFDNTAGYFSDGFAQNCSFVYTQNWALMPLITVCFSETPPVVSVTPTNVNCFGQSTGSASANASGGNGTFTYAWSNSATTATISNVPAGTYYVTVTSNGQSVIDTVTITGPSAALTAAPAATATGCGAASGTATANAGGGTTGYTYVWSNSGTAATITGLAAATYNVTVTDSKGCTATGSATVAPPTPFTASVAVTNVNCFGQNTGTATAATSGATGNLTYTWASGSTQTISNLAAGTYNVTVTETNNCTASATGTITQPASAVTASVTSTQTQCGSGTGTAAVTAGGGTPGYTYAWSNASTGTTISNLGVGNYNVTVTDSKSCTATGTTSVNTSATFVINITSTNVLCYGQNTGTANATVTGASGTILYAWSNGSTTQSISLLPAATYNVTVTDASNCPKTGSTTVTQPAGPLTATIAATEAGCSVNTGTATITPAGGTPSYTYVWSNTSTANSVTGLGPGPVTATVSDANACSVTASATIVQPAPFTANAASTAVSCNGQSSGSATVTTSIQNSFTYIWSNGATAATITNLTAGNYTVSVSDTSGCSATASTSVTQPTAVMASATSTDATNGANGTASSTASGGTSPYTYAWSNASTSADITGLAAGNYIVTVTDANNCSASASVTIISTGINSVAGNITSITLIPNPASSQVKIVVSLESPETLEFRLVDVTGKYIYTARELAAGGTITHQLDLNEYAAGIYLIEITAGNDVTRRKLVIAR